MRPRSIADRPAVAADGRRFRRATIRAWRRSARSGSSGRPGAARPAAERVASIVAAAEETAERMRREAEERVRDRIAEGQRAADNRVKAAEEEATEVLRSAQAEAAGCVEGRPSAEAAKTAAPTRRWDRARAEESAAQIEGEAREAAAAIRAEAEERARGCSRTPATPRGACAPKGWSSSPTSARWATRCAPTPSVCCATCRRSTPS